MYQQKQINTHPEKDDYLVWEAFKSGDQKAYATIYHQNAEALYKYGMHLYNSQYQVEDVIHDLFVYIWCHRKNLGEVKSIRLYLKSSFKRLLLRKIKKEKLFQNEEFIEQNAFKFALLAEDINTESENADMLQKKINKILESLSNRQREIIYLRFYRNMSYDEIAQHLNINLSYTYNVVSKAYTALKKLLSYSLIH